MARRVHKSMVHQILRKRLYCGDFDWDGTTYHGTHEALVTKECWERVQQLIKAKKPKASLSIAGLLPSICARRSNASPKRYGRPAW